MTDEPDSSGDSRRSFMKKGALATTAVALGAGATAGTAAAQDDGDGNEVVVFGDDYMPGVDFTVASGLDDGTRDELFQEAELEDEFDSPEDWDAYIISYDLGGSAPKLGHVLTEQADLSAGDSETMGEDGSFRAADLNLIETSLGGGGGGDDDEPEDEDEPEDDGPDAEDEPEDDGPGAEDEPDTDDGPGAEDDGPGAEDEGPDS
ncbi:hypothetical protein [Halopiger goleimassiliensis]|uniref:hypothetical protein n=1 Tax=Halopiger goleimassiliensis TaxID=1293048 RepID=UPI000677A38B|nr:hypothetical protein [Halopiger goleimassiliensis]